MTSPNPIGEGAREIAGKLDAALCKAMTSGAAPIYYPSLNGRLRKLKLVEPVSRNLHAFTPLGLAVRDILLASTQVTK